MAVRLCVDFHRFECSAHMALMMTSNLCMCIRTSMARSRGKRGSLSSTSIVFRAYLLDYVLVDTTSTITVLLLIMLQ